MEKDSFIEPLSEVCEMSFYNNFELQAENIDLSTSKIFEKKQSKNSTKATLFKKEKKINKIVPNNKFIKGKFNKNNYFVKKDKINSNKNIKKIYTNKYRNINSAKVSPNLNVLNFKNSYVNNNSLFKNTNNLIKKINLKKRINTDNNIKIRKNIDFKKGMNNWINEASFLNKEIYNNLINKKLNKKKILKIKDIYKEIKKLCFC